MDNPIAFRVSRLLLGYYQAAGDLEQSIWYNGQGGYPREKHTQNQPFVDMISIADSLDAVTDSIGRPYGLGKTLEQLMGEVEKG